LGSINCPHYALVPKDFDANVRFRRELIQMAVSDKGARRQLRQMCAEDLLFYINAFCFTYDPRRDIRVLPFVTYTDFQDEALLTLADAVAKGYDCAVPKSRCMGASVMGLAVFEWYWHFFRDMSFLVISRNEKYVDESGNPKTLFWKIDFMHKHQPRWLLPTGRWLGDKDPSRRLLHLGNVDTGSVIDGESTTGDAGRGDRRTAMFIDEHAAFELNDGFKVLRATRDTTKCRIFNSTPQGMNNAFAEVVHNTAARQIRMHWSRHPEYSRGLYTSKDGVLVRLDDYVGTVEVLRKGDPERRRVAFPSDYEFTLDGKVRSPWYDNECARCVAEMEIAAEDRRHQAELAVRLQIAEMQAAQKAADSERAAAERAETRAPTVALSLGQETERAVGEALAPLAQAAAQVTQAAAVSSEAAQATTQAAAQMAQATQAIAEAARLMAAPVEIVRGPDGRAAGTRRVIQ
jgi:hypothetical protein